MQPTSLNCPNCGAPAPQDTNVRQPFKCSACGSILIMTPPAEATASISCPACQTMNGSYNRYCLRCKTKLIMDCPVCYSPNPVKATVCGHCGTNIHDEIKRRESWLAIKEQHDQKRKVSLAQAAVDGQKSEIKRLIADLNEPERHSFAIFYLCQHGEEAVGPLIETLQNNADPDARYGSARALGMIGKSQAIPALIEGLSDNEPAVRYYSIDALVALQASTSRSAIESLTSDSFKWVRERAKKAIKQLDEIG